MPRHVVPLLVAVGCVTFLQTGTVSASGDIKLALHTRSHTLLNRCTSLTPIAQGTPCSNYTTQWSVNWDADVYVVAARNPGTSLLEATFAIDYNPSPTQGVTVHGWTACNATTVTGPGWPAPQTWARTTLVSCTDGTAISPDDKHVLLGVFHVSAMTPDVFRLTAEGTPTNAVTLADCGAALTEVAAASLGAVGFGGGNGTNPCVEQTGAPDPVLPGFGILGANHPNPVRSSTTFQFQAERPGSYRVRIVNTAGRTVRVLPARTLAAGPHTYRWDGRTDAGARAPAGVYFYQVVGQGHSVARRLVLL